MKNVNHSNYAFGSPDKVVRYGAYNYRLKHEGLYRSPNERLNKELYVTLLGSSQPNEFERLIRDGLNQGYSLEALRFVNWNKETVQSAIKRGIKYGIESHQIIHGELGEVVSKLDNVTFIDYDDTGILGPYQKTFSKQSRRFAEMGAIIQITFSTRRPYDKMGPNDYTDTCKQLGFYRGRNGKTYKQEHCMPAVLEKWFAGYRFLRLGDGITQTYRGINGARMYIGMLVPVRLLNGNEIQS